MFVVLANATIALYPEGRVTVPRAKSPKRSRFTQVRRSLD